MVIINGSVSRYWRFCALCREIINTEGRKRAKMKAGWKKEVKRKENACVYLYVCTCAGYFNEKEDAQAS